MINLFDTEEAKKNEEESLFNSFLKGAKGTTSPISPLSSKGGGNSAMELLGKVASASPRVARRIDQLGVATNIYSDVTKNISDWLTERKARSEISSHLSNQQAANAFANNLASSKDILSSGGLLKKVVGLIASYYTGSGSLAEGAASNAEWGEVMSFQD